MRVVGHLGHSNTKDSEKLCPNLSGIDSKIQDILVWIAPFNQLQMMDMFLHACKLTEK